MRTLLAMTTALSLGCGGDRDLGKPADPPPAPQIRSGAAVAAEVKTEMAADEAAEVERAADAADAALPDAGDGAGSADGASAAAALDELPTETPRPTEEEAPGDHTP